MSPIFKLEIVVGGCAIIALLNPGDILAPFFRVWIMVAILIGTCIWGWIKTINEKRGKKEIIVWTVLLTAFSLCLIIFNKENQPKIVLSQKDSPLTVIQTKYIRQAPVTYKETVKEIIQSVSSPKSPEEIEKNKKTISTLETFKNQGMLIYALITSAKTDEDEANVKKKMINGKNPSWIICLPWEVNTTLNFKLFMRPQTNLRQT